MTGAIAFTVIVGAMVAIASTGGKRVNLDNLIRHAKRIARRILPAHYEQWGDIRVRVEFGRITEARYSMYRGQVIRAWIAA